jgi:lipoate-protein ligase B
MNTTHSPTTATLTSDLVFRDIGRMRYGAAFEVQQKLHAEVLAGGAPPTILFVEHEPVVTISKRASARQNLIAAPALLEKLGVEVHDTDRGGDITYHGPGQLVAYPILPLERFGLNLRAYVRLLEQVIIDTVAHWSIAAHRDVCAVGVWVGGRTEQREGDACSVEKSGAKIAAIGVRVKRWVSMHGLALNVTTNLDHFKLIVPCGLAGRPVTSMKQELGAACPSVAEVMEKMRGEFTRQLSLAAGAGR